MKIHYRLKNDFRLSILTLLCACAIFGITPFAVWRFIDGHVVAGVVDLAILASITIAVAYAWRTGDTESAGCVLAHISCGGAVAVAITVGEAGLFWMYPALITSYFLTHAWIALYCMALSLLVVTLHGGAFSSSEQMFSFVATAIVVTACAYVFARRNARQHDELEHLANFDPLTGVQNRRAMSRELNVALSDRSSHQVSYGLAVTDLDHFKKINDEFGHDVGDAILLKFARLLEMNTRGIDKVFRFGGEEFLILFPGTDATQLSKAVKKLQEAVGTSFKGPGGPVTASFGTACLRSTESQAEWFARADKALYRAKLNGRDRIESADIDEYS